MHRDHAWHALLDLSRHARYFDAMSRRYRRYWIVSRVLLGCSAVGAIAVVLNFLPLTEGERAVAAAVILVVVVTDLVVDFGKTAAVLQMTKREMAELEREGRKIWESGQDFDRMNSVLDRMEAVSNRMEISTNDRLNQKCTEDSDKAEANRYAALAN